MKVRRVAEPYAASAFARRKAASTARKQVGRGDSANCPPAVTQEVLSPMHEQRSPEKSGEFARLDGAILGLLVDKQRHPWTIDEIDREIGSESAHVSAAIHRLDEVGLVHSWDEFVCPTHAAIRCHEVMEPDDADSAVERDWERLILLLLLTLDVGTGISEGLLRAKLRGRDKSNELPVTDALARLEGAGLVRRSSGEVGASTAAARFDQIMSL